MTSASLFASAVRLACLPGVVSALMVCLVAAPQAMAKEYVVPLEDALAPAGYSFLNFENVSRPTPFAKEPDAAGKGWRRGTLKRNGSVMAPMAYLWGADGTLRLDLNRNEDLTDDPQGYYKGASQETTSWGYASCSFTNVLWLEDPSSITKPLVIQLHLTESGSRRWINGQINSYRSGKLEIEGKEWELGILASARKLQQDTFERYLLRPWEKRNDTLQVERTQTDALASGKKVFFDGRCFDIAYLHGEGPAGTLKLTERPVPFGEVSIPGTHVRRVVLEGNDHVAVLDLPDKTAMLPVDRYKSYFVQLGAGTNVAYLDVNNSRELEVLAEKTAVLAVGGPLTNTASVQQRGSVVSLSYKLTGLSGEYALQDQTHAGPPRFTIYQGDRKVASGNFEYG
jgi:hypothetical protein